MPFKRSYYIDAPVETAFAFAKTIRWADLAPMEISDVKVTEEGIGTSYAWAVKVAGLRFTGFDVITDIVPGHSITQRSAGAFPGTSVSTFEPEGTGTRWTLENQLGSFWRIPPLDRLVMLFFRRMSERFAQRVKESVEALSKSGTQPRADAVTAGPRAMKRSVHIEAPVEAVYDTIYESFTDPAKMRELMEVDVHVDDMRVTRAGGGTFFSWQARIAGIPMRGFDVLTDVVPGRHITEKSSNAIVGTWDYDFEPEGSGTKLTLEHHPRSIWGIPPMRNATDLARAKMTDSLMTRLKVTIEASGQPQASLLPRFPRGTPPVSPRRRGPANPGSGTTGAARCRGVRAR